MTTPRLRHIRRAAIALIGLGFAGGYATPGEAADASPWDKGSNWSVRLIGGAAQAGLVRAGIEIKLDPGWKTYWRYPGDSGIPPRFDFAGSGNVKAVAVMWPAPHRFPDGAGHSIGYKD